MRIAALALAAVTLAAPALAQAPTTGIGTPPAPMIRAIEEMVNAQTREEIRRRATAGNSVAEVLEVILLNNLQIADNSRQGAQIVAVDFTRQVVVLRFPNKPMEVVNFNRETLTVR